jgi:hypothetical protein
MDLLFHSMFHYSFFSPGTSEGRKMNILGTSVTSIPDLQYGTFNAIDKFLVITVGEVSLHILCPQYTFFSSIFFIRSCLEELFSKEYYSSKVL